MKVARLQATGVHGYLQFDVQFAEDVTFLTGLNGSGKTSALRLLMGLLTPNLSELGAIAFQQATVTVSDAGKSIAISATRRSDGDGIELSTSGVAETLSLSSADLQLLTELAKPDEPRQPVQDKVAANPVFLAIREISTPMFLGLDRRFFANAPFGEDWSERRRRELMLRRHWEEAPTRGAATASLAETNYLVSNRMQEIRASQEELDDNLRRKILARAFEYKPSDISNTGQAPSRQELDRYRERLSHIERAAEDLRLPVPELKTTLSDFFERMNRVVNSLEQGNDKKRSPDFEKDIIDWITNKPQADRILEHLRLLDQYRIDRLALRKAVDKFLELVNSFLSQTNKEVQVTTRGDLAVLLKGTSQHRSIGALSSGERQLLVMLAHLSLNTSLEGSGVFIVDEPELSLHIDWQERIVDAIREANPSVQLIVATHSPAIILDRVENCRTLS